MLTQIRTTTKVCAKVNNPKINSNSVPKIINVLIVLKTTALIAERTMPTACMITIRTISGIQTIHFSIRIPTVPTFVIMVFFSLPSVSVP